MIYQAQDKHTVITYRALKSNINFIPLNTATRPLKYTHTHCSSCVLPWRHSYAHRVSMGKNGLMQTKRRPNDMKPTNNRQGARGLCYIVVVTDCNACERRVFSGRCDIAESINQPFIWYLMMFYFFAPVDWGAAVEWHECDAKPQNSIDLYSSHGKIDAL